MVENRFKRSLQTGRLLIELLAVIAIMLMFGMLMYAKQAEQQAEMRDVIIAEQMRALLNSAKTFVEDHRDDIENGADVSSDRTWCDGDLSTGCVFDFSTDDVRRYLPAAVNPDDTFYSDFRVAVKRGAPISVSEVRSEDIRPVQIVMVSGNTIANRDLDNTRAARLSAMIGGSGGIIRSDDDSGTASGNQGIWRLETAEYFQNSDMDPVRIVVSSDLELRAGVLGALHPYVDLNAGRIMIPDNLPNSVGMKGDLIFNEHSQDQKIQFADGETTARYKTMNTGVMTLNEITNFGSGYKINMDTGRIFVNKIDAEGDIFSQGDVTAEKNITGGGFWIRSSILENPADPDSDLVYAGSASDFTPGSGIYAEPSYFPSVTQSKGINEDWEIITTGDGIKELSDIQKVKNITAGHTNTDSPAGQIAGGSLVVANNMTDPAVWNTNLGGPGTKNIRIGNDGKIVATGEITAAGRIEGGVLSNRNEQPSNIPTVAARGSACKAGDVARWGNYTLTCFNGFFTVTHPQYECPPFSRIVQRPAFCRNYPPPASCMYLTPQPNDPILCETKTYAIPSGVNMKNFGCSYPDLRSDTHCKREYRRKGKQRCGMCVGISAYGPCTPICPGQSQPNPDIRCTRGDWGQQWGCLHEDTGPFTSTCNMPFSMFCYYLTYVEPIIRY